METNINATAIALNGQAILITGDSGAGKSSLALALMEQGAVLISDDVTHVSVKDGKLLASPYERMKGCIEVWGTGIICGLRTAQDVPVLVQIKLTSTITERMPQEASYVEILGKQVRQFRLYKESKVLATLVRTAAKIAAGDVFLLHDK